MKFSVKQLVVAAMCVAIGILLPIAFHMIPDAGRIFLPMHLSILVCGLVCGYQLGGLCGLIVPLLSSLVTGMPPLFPIGISMMLELCAYGVLTGLLMKRFNVYVALLGGMLGGRIVSGLASAVLFGLAGQQYGFMVFITGAFVTALPGIMIQILLVPTVVMTLERSGLSAMLKGDKARA